jgi:hypothetical protein
MLRISLSGPPNRHIQPERYTQCPPGSLWGFSPNDKENAQFCAFSTLQTPKGAQKSGGGGGQRPQKSTSPTGSQAMPDTLVFYSVLLRWRHIFTPSSCYPVEVLHISLLPRYVTYIHSVLPPFISKIKRISLIAVPRYAGKLPLKQSLKLKRALN